MIAPLPLVVLRSLLALVPLAACASGTEPVRVLVTPESLFTIPHEGNVVRFACSTNDDVVAWITPEEEQIDVRGENATHVLADDGKLNATKNYLDILGVQHGMDGRYVCVLADDSQRNFFIPHIVSEARLTQSVLISLSVTGVFCVLCMIILLVDRYCFVDQKSCNTEPVVQASRRKKNMSCTTMATLDFPSA